MDEFSPTEAALEGLRITRERPLAVLWWWGAYLVATVAQFGIALLPPFRQIAATLPVLQDRAAAWQVNPTDKDLTSQYAAALGASVPPALVFALIVLLLQMVLSTAVLRAVLRPGESRFGYLRLSMDEVRQLGLALIVSAAFFAYTIAVLFASSFVFTVLGAIAGGLAPPVVMGLLVVMVLLAAYIYPVVRLSLAPAMTLADGRISFLRAWTLTKGRFWPLFGAYIVAFVISAALWAACISILVVVTALTSHSLTPPTAEHFVDLLSPAAVIVLLVNTLFGALIGATVNAPLASAFRQITGRVGAGAPVRPSTSGSPWGQA